MTLEAGAEALIMTMVEVVLEIMVEDKVECLRGKVRSGIAPKRQYRRYESRGTTSARYSKRIAIIGAEQHHKCGGLAQEIVRCDRAALHAVVL